MNPEAAVAVASSIPVAAHERGVVQARKIPLAAKVAVTAFLAVLVPVYLHTYGPTNFLWFCDAALILTVAGMWLESPLLISMCAVGILLPQCLWLADFGVNLLGFHFLNLTSYMFDPHLAAVHARAFAFSWLAALAARLAPVPSGLRQTGFVCLDCPGRGVGVSSATFLRRPPARIWPIPMSPSTSIIFTVSTTSSRNTGSTKTFMSSCGWACCGSSPFFPRTWPCAKSSPRHRRRPGGKPRFDF